MGTARLICVFSVVAGLVLPATAQANDPPHAVASAGQDLQTGQVLNQVIVYKGPAQTGALVHVTGSGSLDPDGDPLTYRWECRGPDGAKFINFGSTPTNQVNFQPVLPEGTWNITLTVGDGQLHTAT